MSTTKTNTTPASDFASVPSNLVWKNDDEFAYAFSGDTLYLCPGENPDADYGEIGDDMRRTSFSVITFCKPQDEDAEIYGMMDMLHDNVDDLSFFNLVFEEGSGFYVEGELLCHGSEAVYLLDDVTDVTISSCITTIGANLFENSSLEKLTIPASVTEILECVFLGCDDLKSITIENDDPGAIEVYADAFLSGSADVRQTCTLHVPAGSERAYRLNPVFGLFAKIVGDVK